MIFFVTVFSIGQEIKESHGRAMLVHTRGVAWKALYGKLIAQAALRHQLRQLRRDAAAAAAAAATKKKRPFAFKQIKDESQFSLLF